MKSKSQKTIRVKVLGFVLGLFLAFASYGYAADVLYHGSFCNPSIPNGQAHYDQSGVANLSSFPLSVNCGGVVTFVGNGIIEEVDVQVFDRHPFQDVVCTLRTVTMDGIATTTITKSSSGSNSSSPYAQQLIFHPVDLGVNTALNTINLQCTIPPLVPFSPPSHVTSYRVISTP